MEDKENDNIYIYNEEADVPENTDTTDSSSLDNSGPNFSQVSLDDSQNTREDGGSGNGGSAVSPLKLMLKVLMNPIEGWKSVRRSAISPERAQQGCFYPLLAILSASKFVLMAYNPIIKLSEALIDAVCSFVSFFFGYFCILILLKMILPGEAKKIFDSDFGKVFIIISLSTLCLFYTLADVLPMLWAVLIFLPLWTIYIVCRGTKFLKFPQNKQMTSTFILCLLVIGIPIVISWTLGMLLQP